MSSNPSLGTLLAAALETAGYQAQTEVLRNLASMLNDLSALIYLCVLIAALATTALSGHYRAALWLLIGPAMFFMIIKTTTKASGVEWQFGVFNDRERSNDLSNVLRGAQISQDAEVSYLFHLYNVTISNVFQYLIGVITNQNMLNQMRFMSRQRVLDELFGIELDNPNLEALVRFFYAHCNQEIGYATMIAMGNQEQRRIANTNANYLGFVSSPEYSSAVAHYCERFPARDKPFPPGPWQQYVVNPPPAGLGESPNPSVRVEEFRQGRVTHATVSCAQLWRWVVIGARRHVAANTEIRRRLDVDPYAERVYGPQFWGGILRDVGARVGGLGQGRNLDPCPNVAEVLSDTLNNSAVHRYFSAMLIRDQLVRDPRGMQLEQFIDHGRITVERNSAGIDSDPTRKEQILRRLRAQELAESQKYEAYWLLMTLPYLQGIILYALAATFPFFAMMTVLPGQAGAFFTWMAMWAWAKSWDVGWAMVMVIDNILWELLPRVSYYDFPSTAERVSSEFDTPVNMMSAMFSGDHSYSLSAYWLLMSLMVGGIPVLSAQAVMGSKKAIAGVLIDGLRAMGSKLGNTAADWIAHEQIERNDVRSVRGAVSAAREIANNHMARYRQLRAEFDDLYGQGIFDRTVSRGSIWVGSSLRYTGTAFLNIADMYTPNFLGGQAGTDMLNFGRQSVALFESHIGVPVANLAIGVNNSVARPVVQYGPRVGAEMINYGVGAVHYGAENTGRFVANFTVGWWTGSFGYRRFDDTLRPIDTERVVGPIADNIANTITPVYSTRVPANWRNLTPQELNAMTLRFERDAVEARRRLDRGIEGMILQLGQAKEEFERRIAETQAGIDELTRARAIEMNLEERGQAMARVLWGRNPQDELERRALVFMSRTMGEAVGGANVRRELDDEMARLEYLRARASLYSNISEFVGVGSFIAGAAAVFFGGPVVGTACGLTGMHFAYQINSTSIDMMRIANARSADLLALNAEAALYDQMNSRDWYFAQEIRAAISLRGEWWNVPENPYQLSGSVGQLRSRIITEAAYLEGALIGDITWSSILGLTQGKALTSLM